MFGTGFSAASYRSLVPKLSRRETEVARLVAEGLTNRLIADRLFISERTAEYHVEQIRNKLGFHSRHEIAAWLASQSDIVTSAPPASHLPSQLTSFVGRARDITGIQALLSQTRLVTITGAGGAGKTRLALAVASLVLTQYKDGTWFVDLQSLDDSALVAPEVAAALGVADLFGELKTSRRLVVLDNCEHLISACAELVRELLPKCPELLILATSREPLHVPSEGVWAMRPLSPSEGVELFLERARLAAPDVDAGRADPALVESICADLDGLPLAIELAASRARVMSLSDISSRLHQRFSLLVGAEAASKRQRSLEATVAWSYNLLHSSEQILFERLGTFAGGFPLNSAEMIAADQRLPVEHIPELLDGLVERSLVMADRIPDQPTRYRLLGTMRDYARARLDEHHANEELRRRHAVYYRRLAEQAGTELQGPRQGAWLARLERELDEFRAAMDWWLKSDPESALIIAGELTWFWGMRGRLDEGRRALAAALPRSPAPTLMRGRALIGAGWLARLQGDTDAGLAFHAESVRVLREFDNPVQLGAALVWNAEAAMSAGDRTTARRGWQEAIEVLEPLGTTEPLMYALLELATDDLDGDLDRCQTNGRRAMVMAGVLGNRRALGLCHLPLSYAAHMNGDPATAWAEMAASVRELRDIGAIADLWGPLNIAAIEAQAAGLPLMTLKLAGAFDSHSKSIGMRGTPGVVTDQAEPAVAAARASLSPQDSEHAWREGFAMSPEEVLEYLLEESRALAAALPPQ